MTGGLFAPAAAQRPLWPHQEAAFTELRARMLAGVSRVMIQIPTGGGKTRLAAEIIKGALSKDKSVTFLLPRISLIDQTLNAFWDEGIRCAAPMQGDHPFSDASQPVQVASVQTLGRRKRPPADLVIIDEAHLLHKPAIEWLTDPDQAHVRFVGMSATPWTSGLGRLYGSLIIAATTSELIEAGRLAPFKAFAPSQPDLKGVRSVAGDFHEGELAERCDTKKLVGDVVAEWLKRGEDRPTLAYGANRKHAQHIRDRFLEVGVECEYVDAFTDRRDRECIFNAYLEGKIKIISSVATIEVGVDLPITSCVLDARPTQSRMAFVQRIGRGLRTAPGKVDCIILDHAGNHLRLGMVTEIYQDQLDAGAKADADRKREDKERAKPLPRLCDECKAVIAPKAKECPGCGAPVLSRTEILHEDGELIELGTRRRAGNVEPTIAEKAIFFAELRGYAAARAYTDGWASHKYREKFGVWPNDSRVRRGPPLAPSLATRNWITSRAIAWAKGRRADA